MTSVLLAEEAAQLIETGSTVTISASSGLNCPELILKALGERFDGEQQPVDLNVVMPIAVGDLYGIKGIDHLAERNMIRKIIGGSFPSGPSSLPMPTIWKLVIENRIPAYNVPSGILFDLHHEAATKRPGVLTKIGMGTYVDPTLEGCAMNDLARKEPIVEKLSFRGEDWLFFPTIIPQVAIIRATSADEKGNLSFEHEAAYLGTLELATAVHNNGGLVIAQVKRIVANASLPSQNVHVPGVLVDVVVCDENQLQTTQTQYDPAISGEIRRNLTAFPIPEFSPEKVIVRRAAFYLQKDHVVNLGFGICANLPRILLEEAQHGQVTWVIEQGAVGGIPLLDFKFGCSANPEAIMPAPQQFTYFQGGGMDIAFLSFLQIDSQGNVNVSKLSKKPYLTAGVGGFVDITTFVSKIVFCGFFSVKAQERIEQGQLLIEREGISKLVPEVEQITFSGKEALRRGQEVFYVTERCVMRLTKDGLVLEEIAPGLDIQRDVLQVSAFEIKVANRVKTMDSRIFMEAPMGLSLT